MGQHSNEKNSIGQQQTKHKQLKKLKLYIDGSPPPPLKEEINNLIKNFKTNNPVLSKVDLKSLILAFDSEDEEEDNRSNYVSAISSSSYKDEDMATFNEIEDMCPKLKKSLNILKNKLL